MSEMVERVAQAICGDDNPENILEIHRIRARLAIAAMREPTEAMVKEAWKVGGYQEGFGLASEFYKAMIDGALK